MALWQRHVLAASGYLDLGAVAEAVAEIEEIAPEDKPRSEVLHIRTAIYQRAEAWEAMEAVAREWVHVQPEHTGAWVGWAFAARRAQSIHPAKEILVRGEVHHPADATIQFNLGCYACQLGEIEEAKRRVQDAIRLDKQYQKMAVEDPDLEPLWDSLGADVEGGLP